MFKKITLLSFVYFSIFSVSAQYLRKDSSYGTQSFYLQENSNPDFQNEYQTEKLISNNNLIASLINNGKVIFLKIKKEGNLDETFGINGKLSYKHPIDSVITKVFSIVENTNGDIYSALYFDYKSKKTAGILKINSTGEIMENFGNNGLLEFQINDSNTQPKFISILNNTIYLSGNFINQNNSKIFLKSFNTNGQELNIFNNTFLEIINPGIPSNNLTSHYIEMPFIYIFGNEIENGKSSSFLFAKVDIINQTSSSNLSNSLSFHNWENYSFKKVEKIGSHFYFIGSMRTNNDKTYTSLLYKMDENFNFSSDFGTNGLKLSNLSDNIYFSDFVVTDNKIYVFGEQETSLLTRRFISCLEMDGKENLSFETNSHYFFSNSDNLFPHKIYSYNPNQILISAMNSDGISKAYFYTQQFNLIPKNTSLDIVNENNIVVYPKPTNGEVNLSDVAEKIHIINLEGKLIQTEENTNKIDISQMSNGIYILEIVSNQNVHIVKIIKN